MPTRRRSIVFAIIAFSCGLLLWSWDDLLADALSDSANLRMALGICEFALLGPGMAVMAYAVSENLRVQRAAIAREREVARTQRLAALGRVAAGLAHEVRNPLHNIRLLVEESREVPEPTDREELLRRIDANLTRIDRAVELVYRLARPARSVSGGEICDAAAVLAAAVEGQRRRAESGQTIGLESASPAWAAVSADDLGIALDNLLRNALAAGDGQPVRIVLAPAGGGFELRIRNRGRLPAALAEHGRGEAFASSKPGGLGLGLAITRQLIVDCGGSLELRQCGDDVEAILVLPAAEAA